MKENSRTTVTGGAGFLGSHLVERLLARGNSVQVIDNLSSGKLENLKRVWDDRNLSFSKIDLKRPNRLLRDLRSCSLIFHLAANPEVKIGEVAPRVHFDENLCATLNLLEAWRKTRRCGDATLVFASSSTVYGEPTRLPTSEDYGPLFPISTYGATKLGCEALITSYAHTFGFKALILRFANIVGPRSNHGVTLDFVRKIRTDSTRLEILGDGTQTKSYLYVDDAIEAIVHATETFLSEDKLVDVYNIGSNDRISVVEIAKTVVSEMGCSKTRLSFNRSIEGGRGWKGDVKNMQLSIDKIQGTGWKPRFSSLEAIRLTARFQAIERQV